MRSYTHRITDCDIILITQDTDFLDSFRNYFTELFGPRNRQRFARVFAVQNYSDALELISGHISSAVVIDSNAQEYGVDVFFQQILDKKIRQALFYGDPPDSLIQRLFRSEIMLVLLEYTIDTKLDDKLPKGTRVVHISKPVKLEEIEPHIQPIEIMLGSHIDASRNPITRLPSGQFIENKLKEIVNIPDQVALFIQIIGYKQIKETYSYDDLAEIQNFMADIIEQAVDEYRNSKDWVGHIGGGDFFIVITKDTVKTVSQRIAEFFEKGIRSYCFSDSDAEKLSLAFNDSWHHEDIA